LYKAANFQLLLSTDYVGNNLYIQPSPPTSLHDYCQPYTIGNSSINIVHEKPKIISAMDRR
jgi:hypothetical protein